MGGFNSIYAITNYLSWRASFQAKQKVVKDYVEAFTNTR